MKFVQIIFALLFYSLATTSRADVNEARREELLRIARQTSIVSSNQDFFDETVSLVRRFLDGCNPNICFALDGSASIGRDNYEVQKEIVLLIAAIIGANDEATFSAVQYGFVNSPICNVDGDAERFISKLKASEYQDASETFVGAGLAYCISQLATRTGEPAKILLFGDGGATLGRLTGPLSPTSLADSFRARSPDNRVCAVTVNFPTKPPLFVEIVGGEDNRNLVTDVEGWPPILNRLEDFIRNICEGPSASWNCNKD